MGISRRTMLMGTLGSAALWPLRAAAVPSHTPLKDTRLIPSTGQSIPVIGLGSWITFNVGRDPVLKDASAEVIAAFIDAGGGMIDSSPMYASSQDTIGYGLAKRGHPEEVFTADKVWTSSVADGPAQIAATAAKWQVDNFHLMQVHNLVAWEGHLETLFAMKADGRLGYVGVTTSHGRRHGLLEKIMSEHPLDFVQLTYNVVDRDVEKRLLPLAREKGIAVIANRPFQRGAILQRVARAPLPPEADDLGATSWAQLLLKFILAHPAVTVVIPATTQVAHVRENKAAAFGALPDEAVRARLATYVSSI